MVKIIRVVIIILISIALLSLSLFSEKGSKKDLEGFVDCLNNLNIKVYGFETSQNFHSQMALFGEYSNKINFVDCSVNSSLCSGLMIYPTWKIKDRLIYGSLSLEVLSRLTGCEYDG